MAVLWTLAPSNPTSRPNTGGVFLHEIMYFEQKYASSLRKFVSCHCIINTFLIEKSSMPDIRY